MDVKATAIIVAAGSGVRFGASNKAFADLAGRPLVAYSLDTFQAATSIERIVLVAGDHTLLEAQSLAATGQWDKFERFVRGGLRRQDSVQSGLACIEALDSLVAIHDAARPFVRVTDIDRCVSAAVKSGAAILAAPVTDTLKRVENDRILKTVPRDNLWAAQTPQVFAVEALQAALRAADERALTVTDEASLFEALGRDVVIVEGSSTNFKITVPADLVLAEAMIASSASAAL
jgi:2-C-methyl-D-erythritol 4-phosphate cytidylyltransferase